MTGDLDINNNRIDGCGRLTMNNDTLSPIEMYGSKILNCGGLTMNNDLNSSISMNNNRIYNLPNPTGGQQPVPLVFGDNRYLKRDGSKAMTSNLNMGGFAIKNIKPFVEDDSSQAASDAQRNEVINYGYFHTQRGELKQLINEVSYDALNRKNPDPMEDNIDMANHSIINVKDPTNDYDAATKKFVVDKIQESETRNIESIDKENVFKVVMDDDEFKEDDNDIHKIGVNNKDFHSVNKKTYEFKIDYDSDIGYYSTRLSIDLIYLPIGSYTMVYEMYVEDGITIDQIDASVELSQ